MDVEARKNRLANVLKWLIGLTAAFLIAPFIFVAIKGLIGLTVAFAVGAMIVSFAPVFATALANLKLRALRAAVEANPIETMQNLYIEKSQELADADQNIVEFETEIANYDDQMRTFKKQYPEEAPRYQQLSDGMHHGLDEMKEEQGMARDNLADLHMRIEKAQAIYRMALAAERVSEFSKSTEAQVFQDIKEKIAFDSVRTELNRSFASLNMALSRRAGLLAAKGVGVAA